ncbi:MAG: Fur family transcriptional regulator [Candidatus Saccharicenans sp.]
MPQRHQHQVRSRLRENVSRWTQPRDIILDILARTNKHLSAKEIYDTIYSTHPGIGLTTVYRTLELFHRFGVVQKVTSPDGQSRYQLRSEGSEEHHHHLICIRCGKIIDYQDFAEEELELVKKTEQVLSQKHNFLILDHNIEFLGLCEKCRKETQKS